MATRHAPSTGPAKDARQRPDLDKHRALLVNVDAKIEDVRVRLNEIRDKIAGGVTGKPQIRAPTGDTSNNDPRQQLKAKLGDVKKQRDDLKKSKDELFTRLKQLNDSIKTKTEDLKVMKDKLGYKSTKDADAQIQKLEAAVESGELKLIEEKKALVEISQLRKSKTLFANLESHQADIDADHQAIADIKSKLDELQPNSTGLQASFEDIKRDLDSIDSAKQVDAQRLKSLYDTRSQLQTEMNELYDQKRQLTNDFNNAREQHAKNVAEDKARKALEAKQRREQFDLGKLEEQAQQQREAAEVPAFSDEIAICKNLIDFVQRYVDPSAINLSSSSTITEFDVNGMSARNRLMGNTTQFAADQQHNIRQVDNAVPAGATLLKRGEESEVDNFMFVPKRRVNKNSQNVRQSNRGSSPSEDSPTPTGSKTPTVFKIPLSIMEDFWRLKVSVPVSMEDAKVTLEKLKEKRAYYQENQERMTRENKERAEANIRVIMSKVDGRSTSFNSTIAATTTTTNSTTIPSPKRSKSPTRMTNGNDSTMTSDAMIHERDQQNVDMSDITVTE